MDEPNNYKIAFAELRFAGQTNISPLSLIASWNVVIFAYTAADARDQFWAGWRHWRAWGKRTHISVRSIEPVTAKYRQKLYEPGFVDLVSYNDGPPLWRDATTRTSPGDPT
jgi:hypothetical protein